MAEDSNKAPYEDAGPSLLSQQPPSLLTPRESGKDWGEIFTHLESRMQMLRTWRYSWWAYWGQLAEYILPRRYQWLVVANKMTRGGARNQAIVDSTATLAMQVCASGLWSGLTSPSRVWFKIGLAVPGPELPPDAKQWIEDTEHKVYKALHGSNFYTTLAQAFQDVVTFGTAPIVIYEDSEDTIRCYAPCAGEYYLAAGARLSVDTFYREFTLTVAQIVDMFTLENCPMQVREKWRVGGASLELEFVVCHAIEPNSPLDRKAQGGGGAGKISVVPQTFTFREVYWLKGMKTESELSRRGFYERPFIVMRWSTVSNDAYGRSPGMDALGDIMQLQQETRRKAEFIDKVVRPPMGASPELKNEPSSIIPGKITYVSTEGGRKGFFPLFEINPASLQPMLMDLEKIQARIERCFFVDVFLAISRMEGVQPRNELELTKRDLERLQVLGPFIELFETECADPAIKRVLAILERRKELLPIPASLHGVKLKFTYDSILHMAQTSTETVAMKDTLQTIGALSPVAKAAGVPDPLRVFDLDKAARIYAEQSNFPLEAILSVDVVQAHDAMRNKMAMQNQQMGQAMAGMQAAHTLSKTSTEHGNALGDILHAMGVKDKSQGSTHNVRPH
jgi:hypothetical protein